MQSVADLIKTEDKTCFKQYQIKEGFSISLIDAAPEKALHICFRKHQPTINFGFVLSGNFTSRIKGPGVKTKQIFNQAGASGIHYNPVQEGGLAIPANQRLVLIHVHLSLPAFHTLFSPDKDLMPRGLQSIMAGRHDQCWTFRSGLSSHLRQRLNQLAAGPEPGAPANIFYQGIALDLLGTQIARANAAPACPAGLSMDDHDRLIYARELLVQNLCSPPCLKQLARACGLNMNKLQQGFRRLYGMSVFQYLQSFRIHEANRLFHETDMNVSQAAFAVGYTNVSHFSRAYKKHFNTLPKKHLALIKTP